MAETHVYAAQEYSLIIAALPIDHGLVPGKFLSLKPQEQFADTADRDGNVCRSRTNKPVVAGELTLWNWSKHNQQLAALHAADVLSNKGAGLGIFTLIDNGGATKIASDACWITKAPDWEVGEEAFEVTWMFKIVCPPAFYLVGGN